MSVTRNSSAYGHSYRRAGDGWFILSWCIDYKYSGSRLRYPRTFQRDTDLVGAKRFAKKWKLPEPA